MNIEKSNLINGKEASAKVKEDIKNEIKDWQDKPTLAVILVGDDKSSQTYVNSKEKACLACGLNSLMYRLDKNTTQEELLKLIDKLNSNKKVNGILVQLPLPKHIDTSTIILSIDPKKDVDGFHPVNVGKLASGLDSFVPCTPLGIMYLLKIYNVDVSGKNVCVIGRSTIVGRPMANLMLNASATVTITHSKTKNLKDITTKADIVVVAIGKPHFLKSDMIKDGAIVIDVGINRLDNGKLVGDVDFDEVLPKASLITPVPGGVGPMTIAMLLSNTVKSAKQSKISK